MRFLALAIGICAAGPVSAQMFANTRLNLQFGQSDAGPGSVSGLVLSADTWLDFGRSGLQLGVVSQTSDDLGDAVAVRALVRRDLGGPVRLGLSAAYAS